MTGICKHHEIQYRKAFKASRKKATSARLAILEVLEHAQQPLSAEDIRSALPSRKTDLATVYRNLEMLREKGWISLLNISSQTAYYELAKLGHRHHLVCESCGRIETLQACVAGQFSENFLRQKGFGQVLRHSLEYFGLCVKCIKSN